MPRRSATVYLCGLRRSSAITPGSQPLRQAMRLLAESGNGSGGGWFAALQIFMFFTERENKFFRVVNNRLRGALYV
jgi:hypothetical protein